MPIRMIAVDLDGTLLNEDHATVSERNRRALSAAAHKGIKVVIASGRTWTVLQDVAQILPELDYAVVANGAAVMEVHTQQTIFRRDIDFSLWEHVYRILKSHRAVFEVYCQGKTYVETDMLLQDEFLNLPKVFVDELTKFMIKTPQPLNKALKNHGLEKFHVMVVPQSERAALTQELEALGKLAISSSMPGNMEINLLGVHKALGLEALCEKHRFLPDEVMTFGDADNDLEMLSFTKWSFAMANGTDAVKAAAQYETASNREDGVARAIERYAL